MSSGSVAEVSWQDAWERARKSLLGAGANKLTVEKVCGKRDVKWLAEVAGELF